MKTTNKKEHIIIDILRWVAIVAIVITVSVVMFIVSAAILWEYWI